MRVRDVVKALKQDGWVEQPRKGTSHRQFKHPTKPGKVTVTDHPRDLSLLEIASIEKQSGLKLRGR